MAIDPDAEDDDQWRFSLDDLEDEDDDSGGNVAGSLTPEEDLEAGEVDFENALFVAAGVVLALLVIVGFVVFL